MKDANRSGGAAGHAGNPQQQQQFMVLENKIIKETLEMQNQQQILNNKKRSNVNSSSHEAATPQRSAQQVGGGQYGTGVPPGLTGQKFFQAHRVNVAEPGPENGSATSGSKGGFKINIVNVHNEFNIQNNYYIQQQQHDHPEGMRESAASQKQQQR